MDEGSNKKKTIVTVAVLLAIVLIVGGAVAFAKNGKASTSGDTATVDTAVTTTPSTASADTTPSTSSSSDTSSTSTYKDGTYTTDVSYDTPGGPQSMKVSVTLASDVVTDSTVTPEATDGDAQEYQADFVSGYKQYVTGNKIDTISLSRVSGSSLTSNGFNSALQAIENQAKA